MKRIRSIRSRAAAHWLKDEAAGQRRRYRGLVAAQGALAPRRERWIAQFLERVEARGCPVDDPALRKLPLEEARSRRRRRLRVVSRKAAVARPHIEGYVGLRAPWKKMPLPGFPKGMHYQLLSLDTDSGACSLKVRFESGFRLPGGFSNSEMELFVLSGSLLLGEARHGPGSYLFVPAGVVLPALSAPNGAQVLQYYNGGEPSFVASDSDHPDAERDQLVAVDAYATPDWRPDDSRPAAAPDRLVKLLRRDPATGACTFLCCVPPHFRQGGINYHDCATETYQISGTTWTMQFGDLPPGGYCWRPAYLNYGPFASRRGALSLGRSDAELNNNFHFDPRTTAEANRAQAARRLQRHKPELYAAIAARARTRRPRGRV